MVVTATIKKVAFEKHRQGFFSSIQAVHRIKIIRQFHESSFSWSSIGWKWKPNDAKRSLKSSEATSTACD
ncbi:hypothetical protein SynA18461_01824 [Synechococcus sp. A18-46.1]|nr:hypothetical protein SynA18461_01824 [Synechococcus sp. A18-46.1]